MTQAAPCHRGLRIGQQSRGGANACTQVLTLAGHGMPNEQQPAAAPRREARCRRPRRLGASYGVALPRQEHFLTSYVLS
ncbi:hypothetical protein HPP92_006829 [Vanilla planifolia]|uniref:Uncharacterized protein n=1 Tax=Vanilla planifolia TaxID=51239 RepID=A0A835RCV7_VANPL|nr:hypothetical protein HPP92_006829 [Vanilla planifolia]